MTLFPFPNSKRDSPLPSTRPQIPSDILYHIVKYLTPRDFTTLSRVSRAFNAIVTPLLYARVLIDLSKDLNPLLMERRRIQSIGKAFNRLVTGKEDGWDIHRCLGDWDERKKEEERDRRIAERKEAKNSKWSKRLKRYILLLPPIDYSHNLLNPSFEYTTYLTLSNHSQSICRTYKSLLLPNLITLQSIPSLHKTQFDFGECHNFRDHTECQIDSTCVCPLIAKLRPRLLILGDRNTEYQEPNPGIWSPLPTYPTGSLKEIIIYASNYHVIQLGASPNPGWVRNLERVTIVLKREKCMGFIGSDGVWREDKDGDVRQKPYWPLDLLYQRLAKILEANPGMLEIVGIEQMDRNWVGKPRLGDVEVGKAEMNKYLIEQGWKGEEAKIKVDQVRFTDKAIYMRRDE